ncbi:MAG: hypothetical protein ACTSVI_12615 [Promethearchaeota archaeon]
MKNKDFPLNDKVIYLIIGLFSLIGMILLFATDFAGFYLEGYYHGFRNSCLIGCEYNVGFDTFTMILDVILFLFLFLASFNQIKPFIKNEQIRVHVKDLGLFSCIVILACTAISGASFVIEYIDYESWMDVSFYSTMIAAVVDLVLFILLKKIKRE